MNFLHRKICQSRIWASALRRHVLPWTLEGIDLGWQALEVGPGPGLATDVLRQKVDSLTAIEIDAKMAATLQARMIDANVVHGDATRMPFPDSSFDSVVCFTMLHHVPSIALQNTLLEECCRVLRPDGIFAGWDLIFRSKIDPFHWFETKVPVPPESFAERLRAAGFAAARIDTQKHGFRFSARKTMA